MNKITIPDVYYFWLKLTWYVCLFMLLVLVIFGFWVAYQVYSGYNCRALSNVDLVIIK